MKRLIKTIVVLVLLGSISYAAFLYYKKDHTEPVTFRTAKVIRGDITLNIDATGTIEPQEVVDVGAQVAGKILSFGTDIDGKTIDYGSRVKAGMILARIDDSLYAADAAQARAAVQSAKANLQRTIADLEQLKAKRYQAERDWARAQRLGPSEALAQSAYDAYKSGYETAKANVAVGEAAILQSKAAVTQSQAAQAKSDQNLSYCTITSPINGVIIDRRVNIGQTVVSSLNAPSLFLLAKDLKHMEVWVAVNEADIGKIHKGQKVKFSVDTFPKEIFNGEVGKVRLNASMTQNVVNYTVEILTDNSNERLLPYLTADVKFEIEHKNNILMVPNAALRWTPTLEQIVPNLRKTTKIQNNTNPESGSNVEGPGTLWALEGKYVRPINIRTGLNNGTMTEVQGEGLREGLDVVTNAETIEKGQSAGQSEQANPFAPRFPGGTSRGRPGR